MSVLIPDKLSAGDLIGVIAPSDPVLPNQEDRLHEGRTFLETLGFQIKFGQHLRANSLGFAATPQEKAQDINQMFADPAVRAIICAQGGDTANTPLPLINWGMIRQNPKIFLGLSDITVLLNAIYHKTGLITFHGNDILWGFGNNLTDYEQQEFIRIMIQGEIGHYPPNQRRKTIRGGKTQGKLLGGNLRCLLKLSGTSNWPDFTDSILFIEAYEISPKACHNAFHQLLQMGIFNKVCGVLVGYIDSMQRSNQPRPWMEDILLEVTQQYAFPIMKINDFGHNCPNTILPVGGEVSMNADKHTLKIISPCVRPARG